MRGSRRWMLCALLCLLAAFPGAVPAGGATAICDPSDPVAVALKETGAVRFTEEPDAGRWRTWLVEPADVVVPPPPQIAGAQSAIELVDVKAASAAPDAATLASIHRWGDGAATAPWTQLLLEYIKKYSATAGRNPPRFSRQIALFETAMLDALVITWNAKYCHLRPAPGALDPTILPVVPVPAAPSYPSEHAAAAGAAAVLLASFFPEEPAGTFDALMWEAGNSRVAAGASYRSDVGAGIAIGRAVGRKVLGARAGDGWNAVWDGSGRISGKCSWEPTPPGYAYPPAEPLWGKVRPWLMASGGQLRPPAPPDCNGDEYVAAARDLYETSLQLTERQREIALEWAGGPGTETPPGMNLRIAMDAASTHGLNTMRHARVLAYVGAALADAAIASWDAKYAYWGDRPVSTIRDLWDKTWTPLITTPPFPGYVSGHSTFSSAAATVLAFFFPDDATQFRALATEAALSRFYGGIHVRYDNEAGLTVGAGVGDLAVARARADRA